MKNEYKKYGIVMILCFLMGGFSLIFFAMQMYTDLWSKGVTIDAMNFTSANISGNITENYESNRSPPRDRYPAVAMNFMDRMSSPLSLMLFINGIILLAGGISLWNITREKEISHTKERLTTLLLLPDEKIVLEEIKKSHGDITQSQLVKKTGMNKVRVHRIIRRMAAKGIISKHEYGLTNKIVLEKDFG